MHKRTLRKSVVDVYGEGEAYAKEFRNVPPDGENFVSHSRSTVTYMSFLVMARRMSHGRD